MTTKEAYNNIFDNLLPMPELSENDKKLLFESMDKIKQDLERKEELEKENQELKKIIKENFGYNKNINYVHFNSSIPSFKEGNKDLLKGVLGNENT